MIIFILSTLLILAIAAIVVLYYAIKVLIEMMAGEKAFKEMSSAEVADSYFTKYGKEYYDCILALTFQENAGYNGSIFDFSQYDTTGIIMMTECYKEKAPKSKYLHYDEDGNPDVALMPDQKVWLMQDGSYQWDIRPYV